MILFYGLNKEKIIPDNPIISCFTYDHNCKENIDIISWNLDPVNHFHFDDHFVPLHLQKLSNVKCIYNFN